MSHRDEYLPDETAPLPPRFDGPAVKLETRGITPQPRQTAIWQRHTIHKLSVAAKLREAGHPEDAATLEQCHTRYTVAVCKGCGGVQKFPNRCDTFFCPECQPRRAHDRHKAVEWWCREISQPKHVTLTCKNVPDLTAAHVNEFRSFFTKLRRSKFARNWRGGFYTLEVTNEGNGWHLHLHALIDAHWIDAVQLSAIWKRATNGLGYIVKVKDARGNDYLNEVAKYVVKGAQLAAWQPPTIARFVDAFRNVRTFGVFGSLYGARTKFALWWKLTRESKPPCKCGCCEAWYFDEHEWEIRDLVPTPQHAAIPPPMPDLTIPLPLV